MKTSLKALFMLSLLATPLLLVKVTNSISQHQCGYHVIGELRPDTYSTDVDIRGILHSRCLGPKS